MWDADGRVQPGRDEGDLWDNFQVCCFRLTMQCASRLISILCGRRCGGKRALFILGNLLWCTSYVAFPPFPRNRPTLSVRVPALWTEDKGEWNVTRLDQLGLLDLELKITGHWSRVHLLVDPHTVFWEINGMVPVHRRDPVYARDKDTRTNPRTPTDDISCN